jgi:hypothetical protein
MDVPAEVAANGQCENKNGMTHCVITTPLLHSICCVSLVNEFSDGEFFTVWITAKNPVPSATKRSAGREYLLHEL